MIHEGYHVDDQIRTKPTQMNLASGSQSNASGVLHNSVAEMKQYPEAVSGQLSNEVAKPTNSGNASLNSSQNPLANARMLPPGNNPGLTDVSRTLVWGFNSPEVTTAGPTIITSSSSSVATTTTTTATTAAAAATTTAAAAAAAKPPVPGVTYGAWTNYTFRLHAEFQHAVGQPHGERGFPSPTSGIIAATTTTAVATNAKENDDGTWNS